MLSSYNGITMPLAMVCDCFITARSWHVSFALCRVYYDYFGYWFKITWLICEIWGNFVKISYIVNNCLIKIQI